VFRLTRAAVPSMSELQNSAVLASTTAASSSSSSSSSSSNETVMRQIQLPSELDHGGVWGMFELHRRQTVLLNGVALVREAVDGDSEFVFDVYRRQVVDDAGADVPLVEFDSDLARSMAAMSAAQHAHVDDDEDLDAVQHEYPGPSDEEADDELESAALAKASARRRSSSSDDETTRNDSVLLAMARRLERLELMPRGRADAPVDGSDDDDDDDDLFTTTADETHGDVVEREFYFGDYGRGGGDDDEDDFDADDLHFGDR
jgi:hypothetical protein